MRNNSTSPLHLVVTLHGPEGGVHSPAPRITEAIQVDPNETISDLVIRTMAHTRQHLEIRVARDKYGHAGTRP